MLTQRTDKAGMPAPDSNPAHLAALVNAARLAVISVDERQNIVLFNPEAERVFGCCARDALGKPLERFVGECRRMQAQPRHSLQDQRRAETELRESRDRLRELSSALQTMREDEKYRIARELHDELGQALSVLKMDTSAIADGLDRTPEALRRRTEGMKQLIDTTITAVRRIAADLRPVMLDNLGLAPTLDWLTSDFSRRTGIAVALNIPDDHLGVGGDAATAIFRIVQEALTSIARYGGASRVTVEVIHDDGTVTVRVRDNGRGYAEAAARHTRSMGVLGMRERAHVLGGEFRISAVPQGGTLIEAIIPAFGTTTDGR